MDDVKRVDDGASCLVSLSEFVEAETVKLRTHIKRQNRIVIATGVIVFCLLMFLRIAFS